MLKLVKLRKSCFSRCVIIAIIIIIIIINDHHTSKYIFSARLCNNCNNNHPTHTHTHTTKKQKCFFILSSFFFVLALYCFINELIIKQKPIKLELFCIIWFVVVNIQFKKIVMKKL